MMNTAEPLGLHDAELIGVEVDRANRHARLDFRLETGEPRSIQLEGLQAFRGEDLTLQNVVSRLLRSSHGDFASDDLEHWLVWATSLSDASSWLNEQGKREWRDACKAGDLELVVIEPSAGAQIAAVCESLSVIVR
jgi:hypothetical protein